MRKFNAGLRHASIETTTRDLAGVGEYMTWADDGAR
jgi:hypothetical protein